MKKAIFLLNINNYAPGITELTYPLIERYAKKIGAEIKMITERKFPGFPVQYEKFQIYELAQEMGNDWNIYFDSDLLIHPDMFDITNFVGKDMVLFNEIDMSGNRYTYNKYFMRDGRNIGTTSWFNMCSDWTLDLWHPFEGSYEEEIKGIFPIVKEEKAGIDAAHLFDDFVVSQNVARYGLNVRLFQDILRELRRPEEEYLCHRYTMSEPEKVEWMHMVLKGWKV
jgi:glycosyltransferase involved in cell wall biosynthesis